MNWSKLINQLELLAIEANSNGLHKSRTKIINLLESYSASRRDFHRYIHFHDRGYTKNLVKEVRDNIANIIVMCWSPKQKSAFHAHEGSHCFVKVLEGRLIEQQLTLPASNKPTKLPMDDEKLKSTCKHLNTNQVTYIDDSIGLHKVTNESETQPAVTLHVYLPPYTKCRVFAPIENHNDKQPELSYERSDILDVTFHSIDGRVTS